MIFHKNKLLFINFTKTIGNSSQDALREYSVNKIIATAAHHVKMVWNALKRETENITNLENTQICKITSMSLAMKYLNKKYLI